MPGCAVIDTFPIVFAPVGNPLVKAFTVNIGSVDTPTLPIKLVPVPITTFALMLIDGMAVTLTLPI